MAIRHGLVDSTNFVPPSGKVFEDWMVDGYYDASQNLEFRSVFSDDKLKNDEKIFTLTHITHILIC